MTDNKTDVKFVKATRDGQWFMLRTVRGYIFAHNADGELSPVKTPKGNFLETSYETIANRILTDLDKFGEEYESSQSILTWQSTIIDYVSEMDKSEVLEALDGFLDNGNDWTFTRNQEKEKWVNLFGEPVARKTSIRNWLPRCTHMQLNAVNVIAKVFGSINIAYVLACLMEKYKGTQLDKEFYRYACFIYDNWDCGDSEDFYNDFKTFQLCYGIHLESNGPIIVGKISGATTDNCVGKWAPLENLVGRNYYLYTAGERDTVQPLELKIPDLDIGTEYEEGVQFRDVNGTLEWYVPQECWLKRIRSAEEGNKTYLLVLELSEDYLIKQVSVIQEDIEMKSYGNIYFVLPGIEPEANRFYNELDYLPREVQKELHFLMLGRSLPGNYSFIGKRLPQSMLDTCTYDNGGMKCTYALQSAYRMAYMHMSIEISPEMIIKGFDYSTYQSSGNGLEDMYSRPQFLYNRKDEAIDMLLYIIDNYTEEEIN